MKAVRLTRANGLNERVRGDANTVLVLDDADAGELVLQELAVYAPEYDPQPTAFPPLETTVVRAEPRPDALEEAGYPADTGDLGDFGQDRRYIEEDIEKSRDEPELKMPWITHSKADWIAWAVHHGCDPAQAAAMSKNALVSRYGERL